MEISQTSRRRWLIQWSGLMLGLFTRHVHAVKSKVSEAELVRRQGDTEFNKVLASALNGQTWHPSDAIQLDVPPIAENGAIVPLTLESRLPGTRRILVFAENNPGPLLAEFQFEPGVTPWTTLRVKLNASGPVWVIAESEGKFYGIQKPVKVMVGGCG